MNARAASFLMTCCLAAASAAPLGAQAAAPTNVTVAAGRGTVIVSWTGIRNSELTYRVLRSTEPKSQGDDLTRPLSYSVTSFADATVAAGTTYFYRVIAVYSDGSEGASGAVQYPALAATVAPITAVAPTTTTTTTVRRGGTSTPLTAAPTIPLRASAFGKLELTLSTRSGSWEQPT